MLGVLEAILCAVQKIGCWIIDGIVAGVNLLIAGLAAAVQLLLDNQIPFPDLPAIPAFITTATGYLAWFFPVSTLLDVLAFVLTAQLLWWVISIGLRWARAVE